MRNNKKAHTYTKQMKMFIINFQHDKLLKERHCLFWTVNCMKHFMCHHVIGIALENKYRELPRAATLT